jgi:hypothetical protein
VGLQAEEVGLGETKLKTTAMKNSLTCTFLWIVLFELRVRIASICSMLTQRLGNRRPMYIYKHDKKCRAPQKVSSETSDIAPTTAPKVVVHTLKQQKTVHLNTEKKNVLDIVSECATDSSESWLAGILGKSELEALACREIIAEPQHYADCFRRIAQRLLSQTVLMINHVPHRLAELEFYYRSCRDVRYYIWRLVCMCKICVRRGCNI